MVDSVWSPGYDAVIEAVVGMRERAGLTQRELAARIGREQSFVGRIEIRQRRVDLVEFVWIARCCGHDAQQEVAQLTTAVLKAVPPQRRPPPP